MRFEGVQLPEQPFRDDDGSVRPEVAVALAAAGSGEPVDLVAVLRGTRLLTPLVAVLDSADEGLEKDSHLATPYLTGADGRRANLAFTSTQAAARWRAQARVVPKTAEATAAAALGDGAAALVLDLAGPDAATLGAAALHRLAGRLAPVPDLTDAIDRELIASGVSVTWHLGVGEEGVPLLTIDLVGPGAAATLQVLARRLGADQQVRDRCPVGLDFAIPAGAP